MQQHDLCFTLTRQDPERTQASVLGALSVVDVVADMRDGVIGVCDDSVLECGVGRSVLIHLLKTGVIETVLHVESTLCIDSEKDDATEYVAVVSGVSVAYTNERIEQAVQFTFRLNKANGEMSVSR